MKKFKIIISNVKADALFISRTKIVYSQVLHIKVKPK